MNFDLKTGQLLATSKQGRIGVRNFEKLLPSIAGQIRRDSERSWLEAWGNSRNFDEHEKAKIVDPKILNVIGRIARYPIRDGKAYHAGLIHTYGYLLSCLKTRYGFKRERWTQGVMERGLGLKPGALSPDPPTGTLLNNVTLLMSRIAFPRSQCEKLFPSSDLPEWFKQIELEKRPVTRIEERPRLTSQQKPTIFTDLIDFQTPTQGYTTLLVYSAKLGSKHQLFTCFPMPEAGKQELINAAHSNTQPIVGRYNAVLPIPDCGLSGKSSVKHNE